VEIGLLKNVLSCNNLKHQRFTLKVLCNVMSYNCQKIFRVTPVGDLLDFQFLLIPLRLDLRESR
jgi:hypothetical protein